MPVSFFFEPTAFPKPCRHDFLPKSRSDGGKLASYEVAGNAPNKFIRPERTPDSAVPPGRNHFGTANPAQCAGLISSVAPRQFPTAAQIIFNCEMR
jgi:hypothetical protein